MYVFASLEMFHLTSRLQIRMLEHVLQLSKLLPSSTKIIVGILGQTLSEEY